MPRKPPPVLPPERRLLAEMGERLRLARRRRKLSTTAVAQGAGLSRSTLYKVEAGDPGVTLGACMRVLAALGLANDIEKLAADDPVGRKLQDLALDTSPARMRRRRSTARRGPPQAAPPEPGEAEDE